MQITAIYRLDSTLISGAYEIVWWCCLICLSVGSVACQSSKELSRAQAQALIVQDAAFKQPRVLDLTSDYTAGKTLFGLRKQPASEEREQAERRVLPTFLKFHPALAAAHHLGMITIESALVQETTKISPIDYPSWGFQIKVKPTDAAHALSKEMGLPSSETEIPLATKKFVAVTGITKLAENQAKADVEWSWVPNRLGRALDPSATEFQALPADLQPELLGETRDNLHPRTEDWTGVHKVSGLFQRYDDGWRFVRFW